MKINKNKIKNQKLKIIKNNHLIIKKIIKHFYNIDNKNIIFVQKRNKN